MISLEKAIHAPGPVVGERFDNADIEEFHVSEVEFRECRFSNCKFDYAIIRASKFIACAFDHCSFLETRIEDCLFSEGETGSEWRYCDLSKAEFLKSNLGLNRLVGCQAYLTTWADCAAPGIKLDLNCQRKIKTQVIGGGVHFRKCKLQYAEFSPSQLMESIFESCDLRDVAFAGCDLSKANLRGSSLNNADFTGATLDRADLSHATFDALDFNSMASFHAATVTPDQHEAIVTSLGLITVG